MSDVAYKATRGEEVTRTPVRVQAIDVELYPACLWFSRVKARRRDWWLSYL